MNPYQKTALLVFRILSLIWFVKTAGGWCFLLLFGGAGSSFSSALFPVFLTLIPPIGAFLLSPVLAYFVSRDLK